MADAPHVLVADSAGCRLITINRPERRNALGTATMQQIGVSLAEAQSDTDIQVVVLTGTAPAFCAGSDLKELAGLSVAEMCEHEAATAAVARSIGKLDMPVIAAVEGYALGGGCILALSCDLVVSARNVRWAMPEVANGWLPPWGLEALVARVGLVAARSMTWGAFDCDGMEALRLGLADHLSEPGEALSTALAIAARLAALPPHAVSSTKTFFRSLRQDAERLDAAASLQFSRDAGSPAAQAVLARFAGRS
ncbi:enoyl-CoA hydratase/isomerase family protein [Devosia sp. 2618]|uniref:enoyl-CoA hydratase/isomerase family protein n=1 Tax=Devosia sp. 2618 TaxID=3156454 RepID=UPI0033971A38